MQSKTTFASPYKQITDRVLADLEEGVAPWVKPWSAARDGKVSVKSGFPMNFSTGKQYRGINVLLLLLATAEHGWSCNAWATFKQVSDMGGSVRKGSKSERVHYMNKVERDPKEGEEDKVNENGKIEFWCLKSYNVFNLDQCDGIAIEGGALDHVSNMPDDAAELVDLLGVDLRHGGGEAFFAPGQDFVAMPKPEAFLSIDDYKATLFHEIAHWTGHASRLDRLAKNARFGSPDYAFEELVAELSSAFLCMEFGVTASLQHSSYIGNWIKLLRNDDQAFFRAASEAQKVLDYIRERAAAVPEMRLAA